MKKNNNYPLVYFADFQEVKAWFEETFEIGHRPLPAEIKTEKDLVLFVCPDFEMEILPNMARYIKDKRNPYYVEEEAEMNSIGLLLDETRCSRKMLDFLMENDLLPNSRINSHHEEKRGRELLEQNLGFIVDFFRV